MTRWLNRILDILEEIGDLRAKAYLRRYDWDH